MLIHARKTALFRLHNRNKTLFKGRRPVFEAHLQYTDGKNLQPQQPSESKLNSPL